MIVQQSKVLGRCPSYLALPVDNTQEWEEQQQQQEEEVVVVEEEEEGVQVESTDWFALTAVATESTVRFHS